MNSHQVLTAHGTLNAAEVIVDRIFNEEKFIALYDSFEPDAEIETGLPAGLHSGPLALMEVVLFLKRLAPNFRFNFLRQDFKQEHPTRIPWKGTGTHTGKSGTLQPTQEEVWVGGFFTIRFREQKIAYLKIHWDPESSFGLEGLKKTPVESRAIEIINPYPLQARISGNKNKPTLVCLSHGFVPSWYYYDRFIPELTSVRRVITMDSIPIRETVFHGPSTLRSSYSVDEEVDAIITTLDRLEISGPCDFIGGCTGGRLAFEIYKRHPERVRSLAVNEPALTSILAPYERWRDEARAIDQKRIERFAGEITSEDVIWAIKEIGFSEDEARSWHFRPVFEFFKNAIKGRVVSLSTCPTIDDIRKFDLPLLIFQGRETFPVFAAMVTELTNLVRHSRLVILNGTHGSSVSVSREIFKNALFEFLQSTAPTDQKDNRLTRLHL